MRVILIILSLALALPAAAADNACPCRELTIFEAVEQTGLAYVGQIVQLGAGRGRGSVIDREVVVLVEEAIIGVDEVQEGQEVVLRVSVGGICGFEYPLVEGDKWLFFTSGEYKLTACSPDRPLDRRDVAALRQRYGR